MLYLLNVIYLFLLITRAKYLVYSLWKFIKELDNENNHVVNKYKNMYSNYIIFIIIKNLHKDNLLYDNCIE